MSVLKRLFGRKDATPPPGSGAVSPDSGPVAPESDVAAPPLSIHPATGDEHYILRCKECEFEHHIPAVFSDANSRYSVDPGTVTITCLYGGVFTVSLQVDDFFEIASAPMSGQILAASIALNMNPLHQHMLTHFSPIYLVIEQGSNYTRHKYRKDPEGTTFVKFSRDHGIDVVGNIDISKAEIPGIS